MFSDLTYKTKNKTPFHITNVKQCEVRKNSLNIFIKYEHNSVFEELSILSPFEKVNFQNLINTNFLSLMEKQSKPSGISSTKYNAFKKLRKCMPGEYKQYYKNLKFIINDTSKENCKSAKKAKVCK